MIIEFELLVNEKRVDAKKTFGEVTDVIEFRLIGIFD